MGHCVPVQKILNVANGMDAVEHCGQRQPDL